MDRFVCCVRQQHVAVTGLNQIGHSFRHLSPRVQFLYHCYSRCTKMILQKVLTQNPEFLLTTVSATGK